MHAHPLTTKDHALLTAAIDAAERLRVPGQQEVAAALRTTAGNIYTAIHFETAAAFATVCGEVAAISCMVADGHRDLDTICAVKRNAQGEPLILPPCGRCREVIRTFNPNAWIILAGAEDHTTPTALHHPTKVPLRDLLPRAGTV